MEQQVIIGVDVGGTKIMTGAITADGKVIGKPYTLPTGGEDKKELIMGRIFESINAVISENKIDSENIKGIGVGCTGPLDIKKGLILECPQLPDMHFFPIQKTIEDKYKIPVYLNNDANALILGESIWGAGKGNSSVLGFTLGTGLGCAIVLNGKLLLGANESAGEVWISPYNEGTIEDVVCGGGISRIYQKFTNQNISSKEIAQLARSGNAEAAEAYKEFGRALAFAISWSVNLIDPDIIILGGSVSNAIELFVPSMDEIFKKFICPVPSGKIRIIKAELGDYAGFIGAASLAVQNNL